MGICKRKTLTACKKPAKQTPFENQPHHLSDPLWVKLSHRAVTLCTSFLYSQHSGSKPKWLGKVLLWLVFGVFLSGCVSVKPSLLEPEKKVQVIWDIKFDIYDRNAKTRNLCPGMQTPTKKKGTSAKKPPTPRRGLLGQAKKPPKLVVSSSKLLGAMESSATSTLTAATRIIGKYRVFDRQIIEADIRRLKKMYRSFGFFRTKIFPFNPKQDLRVLARSNKYRNFERVQIRVRICEGPQAQVRKRLISWTPKQPKVKGLLEKLPLNPNERFTISAYDELKSTLKTRLQGKSYVLNRVKGLIVVSRDRRWVDVRLWVRPGPACVFGPFRVRPDPDVKKRRVSKSLIETFISYDAAKGKPFSFDVLSRLQSSLFALGVFRVVNVKPDVDRAKEILQEAEANGKPVPKQLAVPVIVEVKEDLFQLIKLGFGFVIDGQRSQLEGSLGWTFLHFFGGFRELNLQFAPGWAFLPDIVRRFDNGPEVTASVSFKQPIFMDRKAEFGARVLYRRAEEIGTADFQTLTPSIWFSRPIWGKLTGRISYNVELAFGVQNPITLEREDYILSYLEQQIALDLRDSPLIPTQGIYFALTMQQAFGGTFSYFKGVADFRFYIPIPASKNFRPVIAGRLLYGVMFSMRNEDRTGKEDLPYSLSEILRQSPLTQRLFSGGANSVRGWTEQYLGPLSCRIQERQRRLERQEEVVQQNGRTVRRVRTIQQETQRTIPVEAERTQRSAKELVNRVTSIGNACRAAAARAMQSRMQDLANRREALPQDQREGTVLLPGAQQLQVVPVGGQQLLEASLELRIPLSFLLSNLSMVLFADVGAMQVKAQFEDPRELIPSVSFGGGFRFYIARIGAVRLDFAHRLFPDQTRYPLQQDWQIHFSFGEAF